LSESLFLRQFVGSGMTDFSYPGSELDVFAHAQNWKRYVASQLRPYLIGQVLEVGAGIGSNMEVCFDGSQKEWICLEPDVNLAKRIPKKERCQIVVGTISDLPAGRKFDSILYYDVLEHIQDDRSELALAANRLSPGGYLSILSPAHQWLYTAFDNAIGHYRRYNKTSLASAGPSSLTLERLRYLDSAGMLASLANRLVMKSASPTVKQIQVWDRLLVPASRVLDPLCRHHLGKSILAVWRNAPRRSV
jgi:hypothetical protein